MLDSAMECDLRPQRTEKFALNLTAACRCHKSAGLRKAKTGYCCVPFNDGAAVCAVFGALAGAWCSAGWCVVGVAGFAAGVAAFAAGAVAAGTV
jgi:hypothetical protein